MSKKNVTLSQPVLEAPNHLGMERLIFFSDAVFAIAITLLALEIRLPSGLEVSSDAQLARSLLAIWPKYLGFVVSFLTIGFYWTSHHRKFRWIQRYDGRLTFLNLLFLMAVAFIPFPTAVLSEYGNRTATIFYALAMISPSLFSLAIWIYATRRSRLIDQDVDPRLRRREIISPLISAGIFLVSIGLAFLNPDLAKFSWGLIAFIPVFL